MPDHQDGALNSPNLDYVEQMYRKWLSDPSNVSDEWKTFFQNEAASRPSARFGPSFAARSIFNSVPVIHEIPSLDDRPPIQCFKHMGVLRLIEAYREGGHRHAKLDPLGLDAELRDIEPDLTDFGLAESDLDISFRPGNYLNGELRPLRAILDSLRNCYCGSVGIEYGHIQDRAQRDWLREKMETGALTEGIGHDAEREAGEHIIQAETFEKFLHKKFVGTKRFSLEGAESLIAALDLLVNHAAGRGVETVFFGMAHRGRLNVLANILHKKFEMIFNEFEDIIDESLSFGSGDVKYHLGYSEDYVSRGGNRVHLALVSNPSHLEAVDPVVLGRSRARQDHTAQGERSRVLPVLIHGDAAFAGQGLVAETLNMSKLIGYSVGGTLHIIINNQLGFTTAPRDARSTTYCTDAAKMIEVPIFHVNGDDVPAVLGVVKTAFEFRQRFGIDAVVDLLCFRRYGHNEMDEPSFTQPLMYKKIDAHPGVRTLYSKELAERGVVPAQDSDTYREKYSTRLEEAYGRSVGAARQGNGHSALEGVWSGIRPAGDEDVEKSVETAVPLSSIEQVAHRIAQLPAGFTPHRKIVRLLEDRLKMGHGEIPVDWGMGEMLTYGTLVIEGHPVRLSGQDTRRGTFSHRHAVLVDAQTGAEHIPLQFVDPAQAPFRAFDSLLSEAGVLGFEYGYSLEDPRPLTIWEAQFGDFANGAQVIIDQFIASAETKWRRHSGLVLLLPHGYEGQGPEHSSARIERYLSLCAENNIQVANATTPAQFFHILRRQVKRDFRKPLILMTPKSLLRHKAAVSELADFTGGGFREVLPDPRTPAPENVERLLFSSGKIYYDLAAMRDQASLMNVSINRLEQLYPFPARQVSDIVRSHKNAALIWVQEEPANAGAWPYMFVKFFEQFGKGKDVLRLSRSAGASPATGHVSIHVEEQKRIVEMALGLNGFDLAKIKAAQ